MFPPAFYTWLFAYTRFPAISSKLLNAEFLTAWRIERTLAEIHRQSFFLDSRQFELLKLLVEFFVERLKFLPHFLILIVKLLELVDSECAINYLSSLLSAWLESY